MTSKKIQQFGPWARLHRRIAYENPWITVFHDEVIDPGKKEGVYGVVSFKNKAIGVLAVDEDNNVLTVSQYRYALAKNSLEIPEGGAAPNELPLDAAKRELLEETGYQAEQWTKLLELDLSNSITDDSAVIYLAKGLKVVANPNRESTESDMTQSQHSLKELRELILSGQVTDAITVSAVLAYENKLLREC